MVILPLPSEHLGCRQALQRPAYFQKTVALWFGASNFGVILIYPGASGPALGPLPGAFSHLWSLSQASSDAGHVGLLSFLPKFPSKTHSKNTSCVCTQVLAPLLFSNVRLFVLCHW